MKGRTVSAVATGIMLLTLLTSTTGVTLAGTEDPRQSPRNTVSARPESPVGNGITYQGSLQDGGNPANGQYDFLFALYDAATGGNQVATSPPATNQTVTQGLFTVYLDFGPGAFQGSNRWLEIAVRPSGGGNFTTLSPRQPLTAAPYAMSLEPDAVITGTAPFGGSLLSAIAAGPGDGLFGQSDQGAGVRGIAAGANQGGVAGQNSSGFGVIGNGLTGVAGNSYAGDGVRGSSQNGNGGNFASGNGYGVYGQSINAPAGYFTSTNGIAGYFSSGTSYGVQGHANGLGGSGVAGFNTGGGIGVLGESDAGVGTYGSSGTGSGLAGLSNSGSGVEGNSYLGYGVHGQSAFGVAGYFTSTNGSAVEGHANYNGPALNGINVGSGYGISGSGTQGDGVRGTSTSGNGGYFTSVSNNGVKGEASGPAFSGVFGTNSSNGPGTTGLSTSGNGVYGHSNGGPGVYGSSDNSYGVMGGSVNNYGLFGLTTGSGDAVHGESSGGTGGSFQTTGQYGMSGTSTAQNGTGVSGTANSGSNSVGVVGTAGGTGVKGLGQTYGLYGKGTGTSNFTISVYGEDPANHCQSCYAAWFNYNVDVNGTLTANSKNFKVDDPLDPANKYLYHTSVESPDMMNIYNGNVTLDDKGEATVQMPDYFQALNTDFRYQLSSIGAPQPNLYVAQEIKDNKFQIAGGVPGAKVSWQVTGVRHDPYALANPSPVEVQKPAAEQGLYQHPELYNQPASKAISTIYQPGTGQQPAQAQPNGNGHK